MLLLLLLLLLLPWALMLVRQVDTSVERRNEERGNAWEQMEQDDHPNPCERTSESKYQSPQLDTSPLDPPKAQMDEGTHQTLPCILDHTEFP